ncbi:hypothetical protein ACFL0Y_00120 [Patescibacteria group bacterium]
MKSKIVGLLFIATGALMLGTFILSMLMFFGDGEDRALIGGVFSLILGIYSIVLGSAIRGRKKWAWYAGIITLSLALVGNVITLFVNFSSFLILPIVLEVVSIYAMYADKSQFLTESETTSSTVMPATEPQTEIINIQPSPPQPINQDSQ